MLTANYLRECFSADPETGAIFWKQRPRSHYRSNLAKDNARFAGKEAGTVSYQGYRVIGLSVDGKVQKLLAHRVMWILQFGEWPKQQIDHINRNRLDNRISNLRDVSGAVNQANRAISAPVKQPATGVRQHRRKFVAYIGGGGRQRYLGTFETLPEAVNARRSAEQVAA